MATRDNIDYPSSIRESAGWVRSSTTEGNMYVDPDPERERAGVQGGRTVWEQPTSEETARPVTSFYREDSSWASAWQSGRESYLNTLGDDNTTIDSLTNRLENALGDDANISNLIQDLPYYQAAFPDGEIPHQYFLNAFSSEENIDAFIQNLKDDAKANLNFSDRDQLYAINAQIDEFGDTLKGGLDILLPIVQDFNSDNYNIASSLSIVSLSTANEMFSNAGADFNINDMSPTDMLDPFLDDAIAVVELYEEIDPAILDDAQLAHFNAAFNLVHTYRDGDDQVSAQVSEQVLGPYLDASANIMASATARAQLDYNDVNYINDTGAEAYTRTALNVGDADYSAVDVISDINSWTGHGNFLATESNNNARWTRDFREYEEINSVDELFEKFPSREDAEAYVNSLKNEAKGGGVRDNDWMKNHGQPLLEAYDNLAEFRAENNLENIVERTNNGSYFAPTEVLELSREEAVINLSTQVAAAQAAIEAGANPAEVTRALHGSAETLINAYGAEGFGTLDENDYSQVEMDMINAARAIQLTSVASDGQKIDIVPLFPMQRQAFWAM